MAEIFLSLVPQHDRIKFSKTAQLQQLQPSSASSGTYRKKTSSFPADHPFYSYDDWFIGKLPLIKVYPGN